MSGRLSKAIALSATLVLIGSAPAAERPHSEVDAPIPWGFTGHEMAARAAHAALPDELPAFFRDAGDQLVYLNPEPDRWRHQLFRAMDQAWNYDHYVDLENVPEGALDAPDRFEFLKLLYDAGLEKPERDAGFLPYRILEMHQRLTVEWRMWRTETDPERRAWIEQRIINDAGVLGHYATDLSQPHHTTIHFNGWSPGAPNPEGYTEDRTFHSRFERFFVDAHVTQADISRRAPRRTLPLVGGVRETVMDYLMVSHEAVDDLYRLDRDIGFDPEGPLRPETRDFAAERLASGAALLGTLWVAAWEQSGR